MQQVAENPTINTAKLIEAWRDSPLFEALSTLAAWDHQVPENALTKEFIDIVLFLEKQNRENMIQQLIKKTQNEGLSESERLNLQKMLKQRHQNIDTKTCTE